MSESSKSNADELDVEESRWKFSLRKLLVPLALVTIGLGTYSRYLAWRDEQIVGELTAKLGDFEPWCTYHEGRAIALGFRSGNKLGDGDLVYMKGLTGLWSLDLGNTQVSDAGLVHLKGLKSLRHLELNNTQVTDAGLVHLKDLGVLAKLRSLSLQDTLITDSGVEQLQGLPRLKFLTIGDQVTRDGEKMLQQALPNCKILH